MKVGSQALHGPRALLDAKGASMVFGLRVTMLRKRNIGPSKTNFEVSQLNIGVKNVDTNFFVGTKRKEKVVSKQ